VQAQAVRLYIPTYERVLSRQLLLPCRRRRADSAQVLRPESGVEPGAPGGAPGAGRGLEGPEKAQEVTGGVCVCTVLCYTCLYSEKETQGPARLRPGLQGGREGRSRC
jgi:hypothetical protein